MAVTGQPIIADVDGDGFVEILTRGTDESCACSDRRRLTSRHRFPRIDGMILGDVAFGRCEA